jgi:signal transduction histidine kinase
VILGALFMGNTTPVGEDGDFREFTEDDEALLKILAAHAAIALTHARLYERERELAITTERARLARELHDAVAQKLFALRLTAQAASSLVESDPERAREQLAQVSALATEAAAELSTAVGELRTPDLAGDGLAEALRKQVAVIDRARSSHGGPRVRFQCGPSPTLPPTHDQVVLRVAQEALHNALRHAGASRIDVSLRPASADRPGNGVRLIVQDDGSGFDPEAAGRGLGLVSMRERADSVGGRLTVSTQVGGRGTVVELEVPGGRS